MNRKIAIIIERFDTALGGAERSVGELAEALSQRRLEVTILAATGKTQSHNTRVLFGDNSGKRTSYCAFAKALNRHFSENRYDIIHSVLPFDFADIYQPRGGSYVEAALRNAASYQNTVISFFKRTTAFANFRRTTLAGAERKLCENQKGPVIAALSNYVAHQFERHYGIDSQRVTVIHNGVRSDKQADNSEVNMLRKKISAELKISKIENYAMFLFAANNFRLKGLGCLIKATRAAACDNIFLMVAGRDNPLKYLSMARQFGVDNRIIFLGQIGNIQNVLSIADVAVLPTFYDPCSRFILEALAANKPVITTKFNGAADLFTDGRHGKVIESPENISELAQAMRHFTQRSNIQGMAEAIKADDLKEKISISRVAKEMETFYDKIVEMRRNK